jgi:hypothetical protein
MSFARGNWRFALLIEGLLDQPGNNREVPAFIVGGQDDRVLVLGGGHFCDRFRYYGVQ